MIDFLACIMMCTMMQAIMMQAIMMQAIMVCMTALGVAHHDP